MIDTLEKKTPVSTIPVALVLRDMDGVYSRHAAVVMASIFASESLVQSVRSAGVWIHDDLFPQSLELECRANILWLRLA